jgi:hypothetical protein
MPDTTEVPRGPDDPEPEEALTGAAARDRDHEPADGDDREVLLDDPDLPAVPVDDDEP